MTNSYCQLGSIKKTGSERLGIFIGLILILNNISFVPSLASVYYAIMFISLLFLLFQSRNIQINGIMIWLYIACIVSILLNKVPNLFHPYQRFVSFFIMSILLSPFMISDTLTRFRTQAFTTILYLLQYVIILSVIFRIFGQGYDKGYFQGITTHSMMLGPFSALCTLYCILQILNGPPGKIKKIFYWVLVALSLFCLLQAASRTAFIAGIVSALVFLTVFYKDNIGRYFKRIVVLAVILVVSFPLWDQYLDKLQEKNEGGTTTLSLNSREIYWQTRIREFESSPFFGIGFASVDIDNTEGSTFNAADGKVESGSSWLSSLSMTGIFGFLALAIIFITAFVKAWRLWQDTPLLSSFFISMLCFWVLHMMAEGYIYAGGSSMFFCVWILLGIIYGVSSNKELAYEFQYKLCKQK